jgi:hypothetical protein
MGFGATKYLGKVCARHPDRNGLRWRDSRSCVQCQRDYRKTTYRRDPEKILAANQKWVDANPEKRKHVHKLAARKWREKNPEAVRLQSRLDASVRRARLRAATVVLTPDEQLHVKALHAEAARLTIETGIVHHVDHDVPLARGGKHHPGNLIVVPASINCAKGARFNSTQEFLLS